MTRMSTITRDRIAAVHMIDWPVAAIEFPSGNMVLADVEDLDEHGEALTLGLAAKKFPRWMEREQRIATMKRQYGIGID